MVQVQLSQQEVELLLALLEQAPVRGTAAMRLLLGLQEKLQAAHNGANPEASGDSP